MKRIGFVFIFSFLTQFLAAPLHAQQLLSLSSLIINKIELYGKAQGGGTIFSHFDKTIYTNNEAVWFTTYLLQSTAEKSIHNTVSIALINDDNNKICLEKMFVMKDGLAFGHFTVPDTLSPGSYHILIYTNVLNKNSLPEDVFSQPITLKTAKAKSFSASVAFTGDEGGTNGLDLKAIVSIINNTKPGSPVYVECTLAGKATKRPVNKDGKLLIDIPKESIPKSGYLKVIIKQNEETSLLTLKLPLKEEIPAIKFYPEGGNLVTGIVNWVGIEAKTSLGQPLKISGIIYKNNQAIDTIQTSSYGIGKFKIMPEKNVRYIFKLTGGIENNNAYILPPAIADFPVIYIKQALEDDTLNLQLKTTHTQKVLLLIHNYNSVIAYRELALKAPAINVKIILDDAPKGLAAVTLLDTLGKPLAERLFFAHYSQEDFVDINTDKASYLTRQKITVKLSIRNSKPMPVNGAVSVACVQDNRVESANQKDIVSYVYLQHQLQELPSDPLRSGYFNKEYVEDILLVKGWRHYLWPDMLKTSVNDTVKNPAIVRFTGTIKEFGKALNKPVMLTVIDPAKQMYLVSTDTIGRYLMPTDMMKLPADKKLNLMIAANHPEPYEISFNNPYSSINQSLAGNLTFGSNDRQPGPTAIAQNLSGLENVTVLKEVTIKGNRSDLFYAPAHLGEKGYCADYVCHANILNCLFHKFASDNVLPILGEIYKTRDGRQMVYKGCILFTKDTTMVKYKLAINGVNMPKEYYQLSNEDVRSTEPEFLSTVYWNYNVKLSSKKATELSFYTGDITGQFRIIVQG